MRYVEQKMRINLKNTMARYEGVLFHEVNSCPTPSLSPALIGRMYFPSTMFCASRLHYTLCVNIVCQSSTSSTSYATLVCAPCYTHRDSAWHHSPTPTLRTSFPLPDNISRDGEMSHELTLIMFTQCFSTSESST